MDRSSKIYVAGHRGLVGSSILRALQRNEYAPPLVRSHAELDLTQQAAVEQFFKDEQPQYVFLAAAKVGGIGANNQLRADFIYHNLAIQNNIIHASWRYGVERLLFLGSSCIYPRNAPQPLKEDYLLTAPLESTNEPYAVAKIAGIKMCEAYNYQHGTSFVPVMPTNLYGIGDNFDLESAHVLPALMRKFHEAKQRGDSSVTIWGTGRPLREFLFADDLAEACLFVMNGYSRELINIGSSEEFSIARLAAEMADVVGFEGELRYDSEKPDGTPRKLLDSSKIKKLGWTPKTNLEEGLRLTYQWYCESLRATS